MPLALGDFYSSAAQQVGEYFREGAGQVADYYRDALRGADQLTGASGLAKETARLVCRRYGENPGVVSGAVAANFERLCRPYLDSIGGGSGPVADLPFRGGQCSGTSYQVTCTTTVFPSGTCQPITNPFSLQVPGPVRGPFTDSVSPPPGGPLCAGTSGTRVYLRTGPSQNITVLAGASFGARISGLSVTPVNGPDNCGNPPVDFRPPAPDPTPEPPGPRPIVVAPGIDLDVDVQIGPSSVTIIGIGVGPVVINPFAGGDDGGGNPPGGGGPPPGDIGSPGTPEDSEPGQPASGCAPAGSVLAGVKVSIIEAPTGINQYDPQVWRGACYVYMGVPGNLALDPGGVALRDGQFFVPQADNLTCYEVRANTGFVLRATPYYRSVED